jgi:hypothetical protein
MASHGDSGVVTEVMAVVGATGTVVAALVAYRKQEWRRAKLKHKFGEAEAQVARRYR